MTASLINPNDDLAQQNAKLLKIATALMRRVEQRPTTDGVAYAQFQRAAMLEDEVQRRTAELERALTLLNTSNAQLARANAETEAARADLANAIETVHEGFAMFGPDDRLELFNSRFGLHMPAVRAELTTGMRFEAYVQLVAGAAPLALPAGETAQNWAARRIQRHSDAHAMFNVAFEGDLWLQVSEHRTLSGGTVILQTDITDVMRLQRQERERLLDDQARLIRATLEHLDQGVCIFDAQARLMGWNQRAGDLLLIPASRFQLGARFDLILNTFGDGAPFRASRPKADIAAWTAAASQRSALAFELSGAHERVLAVSAQSMPGDGFVISFSDVSAQRAAMRAARTANETLENRVHERTLELEDALAEAERANQTKSRFVAAASHDLLQPLAAARLFLSSARPDQPPAQLQERLAKAGRALESVEHLIEALLDISKLDAGHTTPEFGAIALGPLMCQLRDEMAPLARVKGLRLIVVPSSVMVRTDASYLRRILQNLMSNAIRYTESGGVVVGVRRGNGQVRLQVADTGPGIPPDQHQRVFQEFTRLGSQASAAEGLGLGLAIVDRACRLLAHPLHLSSRIGSGSAFSVTLPIAAQPAWSGRAPSGRVALLIHPDATARAVWARRLEQSGLTVLSAASPAGAGHVLADVDLVPDMLFVAAPGADAPQSGLTLRQLAHLPRCDLAENEADTGARIQAFLASLRP